jgi:signal transduction histidine kinase/HAMP domain-containing protein/ActR/RegA family two-component response regulator
VRQSFFAFVPRRLALLLVAGAVVLVLAGSTLWWLHVRSMAEEHCQNIVRVVMQAGQARMLLAQETLRACLQVLERYAAPQRQEEIRHLAQVQPQFGRLLVVGRDGVVQASSDPGLVGWDFSRSPGVMGTWQHGAYISDVLVDPRTAAPSVELGVRGHDVMLLAPLDLKDLQRLVASFSSPQVEVSIADHRGRLIAHPDMRRVQERQVDTWISSHADLEDWGIREVDDARFLGAAGRIQPVGWVAVVRLSKGSLRRPVVWGALFFVVLGSVGVMVGLLVARRLARRVTQSLDGMARQASAVAAGEYDARVIPPGMLELDALAESLNHMAQEVRQRESDNVQLNLDLEDQLAHVQALASLNRSLLESVAEGILGLDVLGRPVLVNEAARVLLDDGCGKPLWQDASWTWPFGAAVLAGRSQRGIMELPSGRILEYAFVPLRQQGRLYGVVSLVDITERENLLRAQEEARRQAEEASRMKDEFLANMSHELRTPLNGIMGVLQLLRLETLPPQQAEQVAVALDSARNLLRVLTDILELSRAAAGFAVHTAPVDVVDVANHALSLVRTQAQRSGVALRLEAEAQLWVESDAARLRQILMNLVGNAAKFTHHGEIVVRVDALTSADGRERLLLQVEDTGIGMIAAHVPHAFERFRQEDASLTRKYQGAGLGLAVVKRLVELMGGTIVVDTAPGEGFWIAVCVPARRAPEPAEEAAVSTREGLPQYGLKVLVVEDDDVNRFMARALLQKLGCHVDEAVNGLEALARLRADHYDVAFLDIQMPEMDGLQTARAIRSYPEFAGTAAMPLVALTAHALPEDETRAREAGMEYFLTKPLDMRQLLVVLDRVVMALAL